MTMRFQVTDRDRENLNKELHSQRCDLCVKIDLIKSHEDAIRVTRKAKFYNRISTIIDNPWVIIFSQLDITSPVQEK